VDRRDSTLARRPARLSQWREGDHGERKTVKTLFFGLIMALSSASVATAQPSDPAKQKREAAAETQLLADPSRAVPELIRRFRSRVEMHDGLLTVKNPIGVSVFPAGTPWTVTCGAGIAVVFRGRPDDDIFLTFATNAKLNDKNGNSATLPDCETLAPAIGTRIQEIISGK
jgi:hypothetical protein